MMPIWIFAVFIVLFIVIVVWERYDYIKLSEEYKSIEFFLDLYLQKYGQLEGMIVIEEGSNTKNEK